MAKGSGNRKPKQKKAESEHQIQVEGRKSPAAPGILRRWLTPRRLVVMAVVASLWVSIPLIRRSLPALSDRPEYRVGPEQVTINPAPRCVPPDLVRQVFERAEFGASESLLDDSLSERIAAAFYTHPWIANVRSVRKTYPARIQVDVEYREPVAMVKGFGGFYPIDRHGVLLPPEDFTVADIERYPVIERVSSVPAGGLGQPWGDPVVHGAAELASVLLQPGPDAEPRWNQFGLQAVLVPRRVALTDEADQLEYQLRTKGGSEILWGRSPSTVHPGELAVDQKIQRLADYAHDYGGFDNEHGPWEIDIRPWNGIGRARLARESTSESRRVN